MADPITPDPKVPASDLLGAKPPAPTRFSKRMVLGLVVVTAGGFAAALIYGLFTEPPYAGPPKEREPVIRQVQPDFAIALPNDYSQYRPTPPVPPPSPAPASPSAVPAPPVTPAAPAPAPIAATTPASPASSPAPGARPVVRDERPSQEDIELQKAAASSIFFLGTQDAAASKIESTGAATAAAAAAGAVSPGAVGAGSPAPGNAGRQAGLYANNELPDGAGQGMQGPKNDFIASSTLDTDYLPSPVMSPISPYELKAGTVIPAALLTAVNSDLPGDVIAQVTENIYDTASGRHLLVPQGARLYGRYDSLVSYGQERALLVWNRIILPNGTSINVGSMIATSGDGTSGLRDGVDRHVPELAGAIGLATVLALTSSLADSIDDSGSNSGTTVVTDGTTAAADRTQRVGEKIVDKELNRPNTITIRQGWTLRVLVNRDMVMRPYQ